jgi:hypothetical protein
VYTSYVTEGHNPQGDLVYRRVSDTSGAAAYEARYWMGDYKSWPLGSSIYLMVIKRRYVPGRDDDEIVGEPETWFAAIRRLQTGYDDTDWEVLHMDVRARSDVGYMQNPVARRASYAVDVSEEGLEREYLDAQGETDQYLSIDEPPELLFGTEIVQVPLASLEESISLARDLISRQGIYGREWIDELKVKMVAGAALPPVTLWHVSWAHGWKLVSGRHRLVASDELGMTHVPALLMWWRDRSTQKEVSSDRVKLLARKK